MTHLTGKGLFSGCAIGVLWILPDSFDGGALNVPTALDAFERARASAVEAADAEAGEEAELVKLLICDRDFSALVQSGIEDGRLTAKAAVARALETASGRIAAAADADAARRARLLCSGGERILDFLEESGDALPALPPGENLVLAAGALSKRAAAFLRRAGLRAILIEEDRAGRAASIARQCKIPAISGLSGLSRLVTGAPVVVDGGAGDAFVYPTPEQIARARQPALREEVLR